MGKRNPYRFSIKLDESDTEHRIVGDYLNELGRKKARIIVKAMMAYLKQEQKHGGIDSHEKRILQETKEKETTEKRGKMLSLDADGYSMDEAEIALMRRNYEKMGMEG